MNAEQVSLSLCPVESSALLSPLRKYRFVLRRKWADLPSIAFLMFNPSKADETVNDHTIRKNVGFAKRWSYGGIVVVNLFAIRSTDPKVVTADIDPVGPKNDELIIEALQGCRRLVCAWGCSSYLRGRLAQRPVELLNAIRHAHPDLPIDCLGYSKDGSPRHPLMLPYSTKLEPFFFSGGYVS